MGRNDPDPIVVTKKYYLKPYNIKGSAADKVPSPPYSQQKRREDIDTLQSKYDRYILMKLKILVQKTTKTITLHF